MQRYYHALFFESSQATSGGLWTAQPANSGRLSFLADEGGQDGTGSEVWPGLFCGQGRGGKPIKPVYDAFTYTGFHGMIFSVVIQEKRRRDSYHTNLFYGTSIATCIMVLKKNKANNKTLFIDATKECIKVS